MKNLDLVEAQELLSRVKQVSFSQHVALEKSFLRGITEEDVKTFLLKGSLVSAEDQGSDERGRKIALLFKKSRKYDLRVIACLKNETARVITAHYQNVKRRKVYFKWLNRKRRD